MSIKSGSAKVFGALCLAFLFMPCVASASSGGEVDIIQRLVNFVLFFAVLWYFVAGKIKEIFTSRSDGIASQLREVENKLNSAKDQKQEMLKKLDESKTIAQNIIDTAKQEAIVLSQKFATNTKAQMQNMEHAMEANMSFEQARVKREVVQDILNDVMYSKDIKFDNKDCVNIITKRIVS